MTDEQLAAYDKRNRELVRLLEVAREQLKEMALKLETASAPPQSFATFIKWVGENADVVSNGRRLRVSALPGLQTQLRPGTDVLLNAMNVMVGTADPENVGQAAIVREVVDNDRLLVVSRGEDERVVQFLGGDARVKVHEGDTVIIDTRTGFALERIERSGIESLLLEEIPDVDYAAIGGLEGQIERIRDAIELPLRHPDLYTEHRLRPPRGLLLYGPPGCGKTLIAKAVAHSLADAVGSQESYFLSVKGPELLNKYVGETERFIRTIFERARAKAASGAPVVVFFDEMDALFRARGSGVSSDMETTIVPQLLTELDGVEVLGNVIVIGASNREDMIDPAILRPGRLDVKIEVSRPDRDAAEDIFSRYLTNDVPLLVPEGVADAAAYLRERTVDALFAAPDAANHVSGAMIRNIVDRAKTSAIKSVVSGGPRGITEQFLIHATAQELDEARAVTRVA